MTETDLKRIENRLRIKLPSDYRTLILKRGEELRGMVDKQGGVTRTAMGDSLYLTAKDVIEVNLMERRGELAAGYCFPKWFETFFLTGTNGAGDYYCLKLKGDRQVWMIGTDCGDKPSEIAPSLKKFVDESVRELKEEPAWQYPPAYSSFDPKCPPLERFKISIGFERADIYPKELDRPITTKKLREHGIDVEAIRQRVQDLLTATTGCNAEQLRVRLSRQSAPTDSIAFKYPKARSADSRFDGVSINMHKDMFSEKGVIHVSFYGVQGTAPPPGKALIKWAPIRAAATHLLQSLHPEVRVKVSSVKPYRFNNGPEGPWTYDFAYELKERNRSSSRIRNP